MRVLIVHDYGTLNGGAEHMAATLRQGLRERGHDARFFASRAQPLPMPNVADYTCYGTSGAGRRLLQVANPWAVRRLGAVLREFRPDVVHVRMFLTQLSPLILPALRGYPALLHVVNYDLICPLNTKVLPSGAPCRDRAGAACGTNGCLPPLGRARAAAQRALRARWDGAFSLIVAYSHWTRRRLRAEGVDVAETVWNGVPVRGPRPPLAGPPTVAYAGRLVAKKGVDVLLRAMALVVRQLPSARLLLLGDGEERAALERLTTELGVARNVEFAGHHQRDEMERRLTAAWVQAVPSRWEEPFGLVAAEAMMRGTAVVATNTGGLSEQVQDGVTGLQVPPGDPAALATALLTVLGDRERAERMGERGRAFALAELTEDRVVERFLALYATLPERGHAAVGAPVLAGRAEA